MSVAILAQGCWSQEGVTAGSRVEADLLHVDLHRQDVGERRAEARVAQSTGAAAPRGNIAAKGFAVPKGPCGYTWTCSVAKNY